MPWIMCFCLQLVQYKDKCVCSFFFPLSKALSWNITAGENTKTLNLKQLPKRTIYNTEHKTYIKSYFIITIQTLHTVC